jgi:hypothetical protein
MRIFRRPVGRALCLGAALACVLALAPPASAQDEPQTFNAFSPAVANGTIVRSAPKRLAIVGTLSGPLYVETGEGPVEGGQVVCAAAVTVDQETLRTAGSGACTFTAQDGATAWGEWKCEGYQLVGCRGGLKLTGGTARLEGIAGEGARIWRPNAQLFRQQLNGATLTNATGIILWRDLKLALKK